MMIDDLDLAFDEHDDKGRHRRGRAGRQRKAKESRRGRSALALLVTLLLLGGLGFGGYLGYEKIRDTFSTPDYQGQGFDETVEVEIKTGATKPTSPRRSRPPGLSRARRLLPRAATPTR